MATLGELIVAIRADTHGLKKGLSDSAKSIHRFSDQVSKSMENMSKEIVRAVDNLPVNKVEHFSKKSQTSLDSLARSVSRLRRLFLGLAGVGGVGALAKSFIKASDTVEQYRLRLKFMLRSTEEANRVIRDMQKYASTVPHTYQEVLETATRLSGIMRGGREEINTWLPLIGDLAAATGFNINVATGQIIRMYSAGAQAARTFREHGIAEMLGFQYGVSYSVEKTRKMLLDSFNRIGSLYRDAAKDLAKTWTGLTSFLVDRWFIFRNIIMQAGIYEYIKRMVDSIVTAFDKWAKAGNLLRMADNVTNTVIPAFDKLKVIVYFIRDHFGELVTVVKMFVAIKLGQFFANTAVSIKKASVALAKYISSMKRLNEVSAGTIGGVVGLGVFAGWELGTWLDENYKQIRLFSTAMASGIHRAFLRLVYEVRILFQKLLMYGKMAIDKVKDWYSDIKRLSEERMKSFFGIGGEELSTIEKETDAISKRIIRADRYSGYLEKIEELINEKRAILKGLNEVYEEEFKTLFRPLPPLPSPPSPPSEPEGKKKRYISYFDPNDPTVKEFYDNLDKLTLSSYQYTLKKLKQQREEYYELMVDSTKAGARRKLEIDEWYNLAVIKIERERLEEQAKLEKKYREEIAREWIKVRENISDEFTDVMVEGLDKGIDSFEDAMKDLIRSIRRMFIKLWVDKAITQPIITPILNQVGGTFGFPGASGFVGPPTESQMAFRQAAPYVGVGAMGYSVGGGGGEGLGAAAGAMLGFAYGGPIGAILGGTVGKEVVSQLTKAIRGEEPAIPSFHLVWEVIDGQIRTVAREWENMEGPTHAMFKSIRNTIEKQADFFQKLGVISGEPVPSFTFDLSGVGISLEAAKKKEDIESIIAALIGGISQISAGFGPDYRNEVKSLFMESLSPILSMFSWGMEKEVFNKYMEWKFQEFVDMPSEKAIAAVQEWFSEPSIFSPVGRPGIDMSNIFDLFMAEHPDLRAEDFNENMLQQLQEFSEKIIPGWFNRGEIAIAGTSHIMDPWEPFFEKISNKVNELYPLMSLGMGEAFAQSLQSPGFMEFEDRFKTSIFSILKNALTKAYIEQGLLPVALEPFFSSGDRPNLGTVLEKYTLGELTLDQSMEYINEMLTKFNENMSTLEPIWEVFNSAILGMSESLELNTEAIGSNTDAIMGPVNSFLASLEVGSLAPSTSIAKLMEIREQYFAEALSYPGKFSEFASYMTSEYLPLMQGISLDYAGVISGVKSDVLSIPWVQQGRGEELTAKSIAYEIGVELGPMLLDIKEMGQITVNVIVDEEIVKQTVLDSLDDPSVVQKVRVRA